MNMTRERPGVLSMAQLEHAISARSEHEAVAALRLMHPAQIADRLEASPRDERRWLWSLIDHEIRGAVMVEVRRGVRRQLVAETSAKDLAAAVRVLDLDELADIHRDLPASVLEAVVRDMSQERRRRFETVRDYPHDTAGGLMDLDTVEVRDDITLDAVLQYLRRLRSHAGGLPEHLDALTVVDREQRYLGVLPLTTIVCEQPTRVVREVMDAQTRALPALMPARDVGRAFRDRDLVSAPVVDENGRLIGRITVDDVIDVIHAHSERAMVSHSGLDVETDIFAPVPTSVRLRSGWLGLHLIGVLIAAWVIDLFSATIEQVVALAALLPVVASMGGVAGSQTLALVVRGMALDQVGSANRMQLIGREAAVGTVNGAIWAAIVLAVTALWFGHGALALVAGGAMIVTMVGAAIAGAFIPFMLARLGTDPALGSGVVVTAIADVVGFASLLTLAVMFVT